jgi:PPOX class probable F420-dependent enzyme
MPSGNARSLDELPARILDIIESGRRGVMSTVGKDGHPHSVPVVFAICGAEVISPIDHKPKTGEVMARVRNLGRDDRVTLLLDHWDEDWTRIGWVMIRGRAVVDTDAPLDDMRLINVRYPPYKPDERHDALIRISPESILWWTWS